MEQCRYFADNKSEKNARIIAREGTPIRDFCLGDGIQSCIVTEDGRIITSYFDEGVFGNYGWDKPLGSGGIVVWDEKGGLLRKNQKYEIIDCYAMNIDSLNHLCFYFYDSY